MARARNIKPGFAKNEDLAECSMQARLCFAMLPMLADREGRLEDRPKKIKGELFAFDSIEVEPLLGELAKHGFIERYAVEGRGLIQIIAFHKHQHPHHKEPESVLPPHPSLRLDADGKWVKSEALVPCDDGKALGFGGLHEPKAPDKPETFVPTGGLASTQNPEVQGGVNPADSLFSDSGALIPEKKKPRKRGAAAQLVSVENLIAEGVDPQHAADWLAARAKKSLLLTPTAWDQVKTEAKKAGLTVPEAIKTAAGNGWAGFRASWTESDSRRGAKVGDDIYAGAI
jgi:hypothetical protein